MSYNIKTICAAAIILPIVGCSSPTPNSKVIDMSSDKVAIVSNSAETTSALYQSTSNRSHYCSPNAPDSTFSVAENANFSLSFLNFGGGTPEAEEAGSSSSGTEMLGRSPAVLAARDIMYRACELIGNLDLTKEQAIAVYTDSLKMAASIIQAEVAKTTITQSSTLGIQASETTATLPNMSTENSSNTCDSNTCDSNTDDINTDDSY